MKQRIDCVFRPINCEISNKCPCTHFHRAKILSTDEKLMFLARNFKISINKNSITIFSIPEQYADTDFWEWTIDESPKLETNIDTAFEFLWDKGK